MKQIRWIWLRSSGFKGIPVAPPVEPVVLRSGQVYDLVMRNGRLYGAAKIISLSFGWVGIRWRTHTDQIELSEVARVGKHHERT